MRARLYKSADNLDGVLRVQAAFFFGRVFPPPTAVALVLVRAHRTGAGFATNGDKTLVVQGIVGNAMVADVGPNIGRGPIGEGG